MGNAAQLKLEPFLEKRFNLVDKERVAEIMAREGKQVPETEEEIRELGALLGADYLLFGAASGELEEGDPLGDALKRASRGIERGLAKKFPQVYATR